MKNDDFILFPNVYTNNVEDVSYLIGAFLGDGSIYENKGSFQFSITSSDYGLCFECQRISFNLFGKGGRIKEVRKDNKFSYYQLVICSKNIVNFFREMTKKRLFIPKFVYINNLTTKAFIQGLMDSDGWICKVNPSDGYIRYRVGFKNISNWTNEFREMFDLFNVKAGKVRRVKNGENKEAFCFTVNTQDYCEKIGFRIDRKQELVSEYFEWKKLKN